MRGSEKGGVVWRGAKKRKRSVGTKLLCKAKAIPGPVSNTHTNEERIRVGVLVS